MPALRITSIALLVLALLPGAPLAGTPKTPKNAILCPADMVLTGSVCVDKYEASVWSVPATDTSLVARVKGGAVTLEDLTAGGASQVGAAPEACTGTEYPAEFPRNGNWTAPLFALSLPGVPPSTCISWYQAAQACALAGKRLLRNDEWQAAAAGTPDPGAMDDGAAQCNVSGAGAANAGARTGCLSSWLAGDLIGNVSEWTADWDEKGDDCTHLGAEFGDGEACLGGDAVGNRVFALVRGGSFLSVEKASIFGVKTENVETQARDLGFRCGREATASKK